MSDHLQANPHKPEKLSSDVASRPSMLMAVLAASIIGEFVVIGPLVAGAALNGADVASLFGAKFVTVYVGTPLAIILGPILAFPLILLALRLKWTSRLASLLLGGAAGATIGLVFLGPGLFEDLSRAGVAYWSKNLDWEAIGAIAICTTVCAIAGYVARTILLAGRKG